jgi:hypothetical protein
MPLPSKARSRGAMGDWQANSGSTMLLMMWGNVVMNKLGFAKRSMNEVACHFTPSTNCVALRWLV